MKLDGIDLIANSPITDNIIGNAELKTEAAVGNKNIIINGNFDVWQRGTSLTAAAGNRYLSDRWLNTSIGSTHAVTRESFVIGQTDVPGNPEFYHRVVVASVGGSGNLALLDQRIENTTTFSGDQITLSFWAKADAAKNIATEFTQNPGTGGSPSGQINTIGSTTHALTTSWQKFTVTTTLPSLLGKTLGTNNDNFLSVHFWFDAGSTYDGRTNTLGQQSGTFDIAQVQIENGSVATPFEKLDLSSILVRCKRYYETSGGQEEEYSAPNNGTLTGSSGAYRFAVEKRAIPTMTRVQTVSSNLTGTLSVTSANVYGFRSSGKTTSANFNKGNYRFTWTADAEL